MLPLFLKLLAPFFLIVGALHLVLGLNADVLLGAQLSEQAIVDPVLDSQNRFYAVSFTIYGVLFYFSGLELERYAPILRASLWVFFAAALARIVSIVIVGFPSQLVLALIVIELCLPPIMLILLKRFEEANRNT